MTPKSDERLSAALKQASFCLRELLPDHPDAKMTVRMIHRALSALQETATQDASTRKDDGLGNEQKPSCGAAPSAGEPEEPKDFTGLSDLGRALMWEEYARALAADFARVRADFRKQYAAADAFQTQNEHLRAKLTAAEQDLARVKREQSDFNERASALVNDALQRAIAAEQELARVRRALDDETAMREQAWIDKGIAALQEQLTAAEQAREAAEKYRDMVSYYLTRI